MKAAPAPWLALGAWTLSAIAPAQVSVPDPQSTYVGRLLFDFDESALYLRERRSTDVDPASCVSVRPSADSLRERMERVQNAWVRIKSVSWRESGRCLTAVSVASVDEIEIISPPEALPPATLDGYLPEKNIAHARDIRRRAVEAMHAIAKRDYDVFRRMRLLDPKVDPALVEASNDYPRRRFLFIAQHLPEFFGAAVKTRRPQVIVRQFEGRNTSAAACICRRSTKCRESDTFDAPRLGSWGDSMFCFRFYYDGDAETDQYQPSQWLIADPIFG